MRENREYRFPDAHADRAGPLVAGKVLQTIAEKRGVTARATSAVANVAGYNLRGGIVNEYRVETLAWVRWEPAEVAIVADPANNAGSKSYRQSRYKTLGQALECRPE